MERLTGSSQSVVKMLIQDGPLSRGQLGARLELSRASLTRLANPLLADGLLVEKGRQQVATIGRPSRLLDVAASSHHFVGINLQGDGTAVGVLTDLRATVAATDSVRLGGQTSDDVADTLVQLARRLAHDAPEVIGVGISLGAHVTDGGVVQRAPFLGWQEPVELGEQLERRIGVPPSLDNDLVALTRAEQWFGAGRDHDHVAVLTIGAGIGYGLMIHGQVVTGPGAELGLVGHHPLDANGPICPDGHRGCAHAMLATDMITRRASLAIGRPIDYETCLSLARDKHPAAVTVMREAGMALGRLIAAVANLAMPEVVVLAGEGIGLMDVAEAEVVMALRHDRPVGSTPVLLQTRPAGYPLWARGAAVVAIDSYVEQRLTSRPTTLRALA